LPLEQALAFVLLNPCNPTAAVGNALGTNFVNIGLALGIPAFLLTIITKYEVFEKEIPIYLGMTAISTGFALDGSITPFEGLFILSCYFMTLFIIYQYAKREKIKAWDIEQVDVDSSTISETKIAGISVRKAVFSIVIGITCLIFFSIVLARMTPVLSKDFGVSEYVLGLSMIGIGTSLPTIVTSIRSARKGYVDIVLGNVFGGTIANIALGLGLPAIFCTLKFDSEAISDIYYFNIFNIVVVFGVLIEMKLLGNKGTLNKVSGIVMVGIYLVYLGSKLLGI